MTSIALKSDIAWFLTQLLTDQLDDDVQIALALDRLSKTAWAEILETIPPSMRFE